MPHTRLFRFIVTPDITAVPDFINKDENAFSPDPTGYFLSYAVAGPDAVELFEGDWKRVPDVLGVMDFPLSTVERSHFWIGVSVLPNSKGDPKDPAWEPMIRGRDMKTDDFTCINAGYTPELVKKFPDGVFILQINLVAFYLPIMVPGLNDFRIELAQAGIRPEDIIYHGMNPNRDAAGKAISAQHHVVYWSDDLHLSGQKYVP